MVTGVLEDHIVIATDVEHFEVGVVDLPVTVPGTEGFCNRACPITLQDSLFQQSCSMYHADLFTFYYLVANTPADDAGVVAITQHHGVDILTIAGVDEGGVVVGILLCAPAVESLVDDKHAYRVAGIEEGSGGGVVGCTDEVEACFLHQPDLADLCRIEGHGSQQTVVVMHTATIQEHGFAVEHETTFRIKRVRADAIVGSLLADGLACLPKFCLHLVAMRIIRRPEMRIIHHKRSGNSLRLSGRHTDHQLAITHSHRSVSVLIGFVLYRYFHLDNSLVALHLRRSDKHTVLCDMQGRHRLQPYMTVDTRTRIPAAVWLLAVVYFYHHLVHALVAIQERCHVDGEGGVAIGVLPGLLTIDEDFGLLIDTLEVELYQFADGCLEAFAILALTCCIPATTRASSTFLRIWGRKDVPVVRQIHTNGLTVVRKLPALIEKLVCLCECT